MEPAAKAGNHLRILWLALHNQQPSMEIMSLVALPVLCNTQNQGFRHLCFKSDYDQGESTWTTTLVGIQASGKVAAKLCPPSNEVSPKKTFEVGRCRTVIMTRGRPFFSLHWLHWQLCARPLLQEQILQKRKIGSLWRRKKVLCLCFMFCCNPSSSWNHIMILKTH